MMNRILVASVALALTACATTTPERLAQLQDEVAAEMGIAFFLPAPTLVETFDLSPDGRTLALTTCWTNLKAVKSIQYAAGVDWERSMAIIAHEMHHTIQCHSGRMQTLTPAQMEREAEDIEAWWRAGHSGPMP